jgi:luciferase-like monooxygenase
MSVREEVEGALCRLPGLEPRPARSGRGFSYFFEGQEIAHFHGEERIDVRLTRERIPELKARGAFDARVRTRGPSADWAAVRLSEPSDLSLALRLVKEAIRIHRGPAAGPTPGTG